jgi:integrase
MDSTEKKTRGKRGQGCIYRRKGSRNWWIKFSVRGQTYQEPANTESKKEALNFLKKRVGEESTGMVIDSENVTVSVLKENLTKAWEREGRKESTREWAERCWNRLLPYFGKMRATDALRSAAIQGYQDKRKAEKAANGTINRELAVLSCAFTLGYEHTPRLVPEKLHFKRLKESEARKGFIEEKQYRLLAAKCKEPFMRAMLALGYTYGFRKAELLGMKVCNVDLLRGTVGIYTSKNGDARKVSLTKEAEQLLAACIAGKGPEEALFTRRELSGKQVPVADFRGTWDTLAEAAGCAGLLFHDLRRSAVRNMVRAGIPETVCMKISGHKTRDVFDRYDISSERDLIDAAKKLESAQSSYSLVTADEIDSKTVAAQNETIQ